MDQFIYVFDLDSKNKLLDQGYCLLQETDKLYIFENKPSMQFDLLDKSKYIYNNTLFI